MFAPVSFSYPVNRFISNPPGIQAVSFSANKIEPPVLTARLIITKNRAQATSSGTPTTITPVTKADVETFLQDVKTKDFDINFIDKSKTPTSTRWLEIQLSKIKNRTAKNSLRVHLTQPQSGYSGLNDCRYALAIGDECSLKILVLTGNLTTRQVHRLRNLSKVDQFTLEDCGNEGIHLKLIIPEEEASEK